MPRRPTRSRPSRGSRTARGPVLGHHPQRAQQGPAAARRPGSRGPAAAEETALEANEGAVAVDAQLAPGSHAQRANGRTTSMSGGAIERVLARLWGRGRRAAEDEVGHRTQLL